MQRWKIFGVSILGLLVVTSTFAQTIDGIDIAAIKAAAQGQQEAARQVVDAANIRGKPYETEAEKMRQQAMEKLTQLSPEDFPKGPDGAVDFDEMLAGAAGNAARPQGEAPLFMVFASLSMPEASLKRLIRDTTRAGGVVVFRGFPNNNAKQFIAGMSKVVGDEGDEPSIGIDPRLFRAFNVQAAPTYVIASTDFDLCDGFDCITAVPTHDRLTGNVTVEYVLEAFAEGKGPGASVAAVALKNLKKPS
jgi:conjugal transfer pilus assembly protein TrbC